MAAVQGGQPSQKDNKNQVAQPPLVSSVIDESGKISKPWAIWFRAIYNRIGYKGEENLNAIDENVNEIDGVVDTIEEVVIVLEDHEVRIGTNADNISTNADNISTNTQGIDTNSGKISNNSLAISENTDYIDLTREQSKAAFVAAGYGGIAVVAQDLIGTVDSTFKTIEGYDTDIVSTPLDITYDKVNHGMEFDRVGVWSVTFNLTLTFDDSNSGREMQLRPYNATTGLPAATVYTYFVGRNQFGANLSLTQFIEIDLAEVGDLLQFQIGSDSDTFTDVVNIGSIYQAVHISERKEDLGV